MAKEKLSKIKARIEGRIMAEEVFGMITCDGEIPPWINGTGADFAESLLRELADRLPKKRKDVVQKQEVPLIRLSSERIGFGEHAGEKYEDIPIAYLEWLLGVSEDLCKSLTAYLRHDDMQRKE